MFITCLRVRQHQRGAAAGREREKKKKRDNVRIMRTDQIEDSIMWVFTPNLTKPEVTEVTVFSRNIAHFTFLARTPNTAELNAPFTRKKKKKKCLY